LADYEGKKLVLSASVPVRGGVGFSLATRFGDFQLRARVLDERRSRIVNVDQREGRHTIA